MGNSFFFALLRISIAQILKAAGFDKCKPVVINVITDLYIHYLKLLVNETKKFSMAKTNSVSEIGALDLLNAFISTGFIKGSLVEDENETANSKSLDSFVKWVQYSDAFTVSKRLNSVPKSMLLNLMEKRKLDTSSETEQERKKRRLRERQEFYNQLKQGEDSNSKSGAKVSDHDLEDDDLNNDQDISWLDYVAEKDLKLDQNTKFLNTCLQDELMALYKIQNLHPNPAEGEDSLSTFKNLILNCTKNDHVLLQVTESAENADNSGSGVTPSLELKSALPYNIKYHASLLDDSLEQYSLYASNHEEEIQRRLLELATNDTPKSDYENNKDKQDSSTKSDDASDLPSDSNRATEKENKDEVSTSGKGVRQRIEGQEVHDSVAHDAKQSSSSELASE